MPAPVAEKLLNPIMYEFHTLAALLALTPLAKSLLLKKAPPAKVASDLNDAFNVRMGALRARIKHALEKIGEMELSDVEFTASLEAGVEALEKAYPYVRDLLLRGNLTTEALITSFIREKVTEIRKNRSISEPLDDAVAHIRVMKSRIHDKVTA